ncbi:MAG: tetratricopeptide repeat protein [bacterium]|nr:tetratricopeptide repeat protein [bacterium]
MWIIFLLIALPCTAILGAPPSFQAQPQETVDAAAGEHNNKGAQLANQGRLQEAVREFQQAIQMVPNFTGAYYNLGRVYMQMKAYDDAARAFAAAVQVRSNYGEGWYQLGIALQMQNQFSDAGKAYLSALSYFPGDPDLLYRLGFVFVQQKDWAQAAVYWGRLRGEYPDHPALAQIQNYLPHLYYNIGTELYTRGELKEAENAFLKTLNIDPGYGPAFYNLGLVYRDLEQFDESQNALENALQTRYDSLQVQSVLGHVLALKGSLEDAEALFQKLLKNGTQSLDPHRGLVTVKLKQKDLPGALVQALTVVANAPRDPSSFLLLAYVYEHNRDCERYGPGFQADKAITAYGRAAQLNPRDPVAQFNLGMLYGRLGDWQASLKALKKAQEIAPDHPGVEKWLADVQARLDQAQ